MRRFELICPEQWKKDIPHTPYGDVFLPRRATARSAGYDLFAPVAFTLAPGGHVVVPTGIKAYMNPDEVLLINGRSGHGFKRGIRLRNIQGWVDADYADNESNEGHILVALTNDGNEPFAVRKGEAFCQAMFMRFLKTDDDEGAASVRRGGFGST